MDPIQAQAYLALFDGLLTAAERIAQEVAKARADGVVTVEQQQAQLDRIEQLRQRVSS